jgi:superfamily I DNA/RNA helicase
LLARWRAAAVHMLVDEAQDLDRSQLSLALLLAAPRNRVFLVGDDDQSIYGWRLADVRRVLGLAAQLPGLRRVDLEVNYRCPAVVLERAVRLVEVNRERFVKRIRPGPMAAGRLVLAPDAGEETERVRRVLAAWPADDGDDATRAFLARTNRELLPAAAVLLERGVPFRAARIAWPLESPFLDELLASVAATDPRLPLLVRIGLVRDSLPVDEPAQNGDDDVPAFTRAEVATALLAWAAAYPDPGALTAAIAERRTRLVELRRDDALVTLATAHSTKGLEFDHVAVLADGFPAHRSVAEAAEPERELEEERRLAYVAWTRARRSLTLVYDPLAPSRFLLEAFTPAELGLAAAA